MKFQITNLFVIWCLVLGISLAEAKEAPKEPTPELTGTLGSALLLIGTSSAETVDNVLKGVESFGKSIERFTPDQRNFLFGYANYRLGKWREADGFFKRCGENALLGDHVLFYRGRIAIAVGENERAEDLLTQLINDKAGSVWANDARRYLAQAKINLGRFDEARQLIGQYLKGTTLVSDVFEANLLLARSYIAQGDEEEALLHLKNLATSVISENELSEIIKVAFDADKKIGTRFERWLGDPSTQYDIAQTLMEHSQWTDTLSHIEKVLSADGFEAKWLNARCHFKAHLYREAIPILEGLLKNDGYGKLRLTLLQHLASAYARIDDYKHSIKLRRQIIREYSRAPSVVLDSQSKIAFLLLDDGHYKEAIDALEKVLKFKGSASMRTKTLWYIAWSYYKLKDYDAAIRIMNELLKGGAKKSKVKIDDRVAYWKARSHENAGRHKEARALYREILDDHPIGYYGVLSKRRLNNDVRDADNFVDAAPYKWPKGRFSVNVPRAETFAPQSPHLARAIVFNKLDLHDLVAKELASSVETEKGADTNLIMWLASKNYMHDIPYMLAHQRYMSILHSLPQSGGFERFIWEQSYPEAYRPVVERLVGHRFDPKLVYAIMRAESTFRPAVVSPAGAIGLMQLMPVTAQKMASELGEPNFDSHELYRSAKNIEYGIQYLKKLYGLFPKNTVAVIASYNAGEEAVGRWLGHGYSPDIEEFIEEIPYDETNLYVKKVLMSYWILQQMYSQ